MQHPLDNVLQQANDPSHTIKKRKLLLLKLKKEKV